MNSYGERLNESAGMVGEYSRKPLQFTSLEDYWNSPRATSLIEELHAIYPFRAPQKRDEKLKKLQLFVQASFQEIAESVLVGQETKSKDNVFYTAKNTTKLFVKSGEGVEVSSGMFGLRQLIHDGKVVPIPDALVVRRKGTFAEVATVYAYARSKADEAKVREQYQHYLDNLADGKYTSETKFTIVVPSDIHIDGIADATNISLPFSSQDFETSWIDHLTPVGFGKDLAHFGYIHEESATPQSSRVEQNGNGHVSVALPDLPQPEVSQLVPIIGNVFTDYMPTDPKQDPEGQEETFGALEEDDEDEAFVHPVKMRRNGHARYSRRGRDDWE